MRRRRKGYKEGGKGKRQRKGLPQLLIRALGPPVKVASQTYETHTDPHHPHTHTPLCSKLLYVLFKENNDVYKAHCDLLQLNIYIIIYT